MGFLQMMCPIFAYRKYADYQVSKSNGGLIQVKPHLRDRKVRASGGTKSFIDFSGGMGYTFFRSSWVEKEVILSCNSVVKTALKRAIRQLCNLDPQNGDLGCKDAVQTAKRLKLRRFCGLI